MRYRLWLAWSRRTLAVSEWWHKWVRRTPSQLPETHPPVGLIRTERNIDPIAFGTDAALRVLLEDEARAQRRADAEDVLRRAGMGGDAA